MTENNSQVSKEALVNEYKGNIFEFLVAKEISSHFNIESNFLISLNELLKSRLSEYEEYLREYDLSLVKSLVVLSKLTVKEIISYLNTDISEVILIGKTVNVKDTEIWSETDIVLKTTSLNKQYLLSVKLSKDNSFTNTKSAGAKSFIEKYFSIYGDSKNDQVYFNKQVEILFLKLAKNFYDSENLEFRGSFDSSWNDSYPTLPGDLDSEKKEELFAFYSEQIKLLYQVLKKYYLNDKKTFLKCLNPLIGLSDENIIQVVTYHKDHQLSSIKINDNSIINNSALSYELLELKNNSHYIEIDFKSIILQIRIKPMNKFTTLSYKINCSVKGKDKHE